MAEEIDTGHSPDLDNAREHGVNLHKRQSRVTVKYNRKQLQKRLDVEKWIDEGLDKLYEGKVSVHRILTCAAGAELILEATGELLLEKKYFDGKINDSDEFPNAVETHAVSFVILKCLTGEMCDSSFSKKLTTNVLYM